MSHYSHENERKKDELNLITLAQESADEDKSRGLLKIYFGDWRGNAAA